MSLLRPRRIHSVTAEQATALGKALARTDVSDAATLGIGAAAVPLAPDAREAVIDVLERLAAGDSVVIASSETLLTTSQAAEMIGISHTYLLRLADGGRLPVQYRGTHRRFAVADVVRYVEAAHTKPPE
jgi:excisionase family DNA binding protein